MNDDLISRQAAIDAIWSHATKILENSDYDLFIQDIYKMTHRHIAELIEQIPSAQPERKGKWIKDSDVAFYWKCSECGAYLIWRKEDYLLRHEDEARFCPNCGAKMEEEE